MKIGVISDTHLTGHDRRLTEIADFYFHDCDLILHAGDLIHADVLEALGVKRVKAVQGNMDLPSVKRILPDKAVLEVGGFKIGLIHGWGGPQGLEEKLLDIIGRVDCLVYGHTHEAVNKTNKEGVLIFNPGSATDRRQARRRSIGVLTVDKAITGSIIQLEDY